jgi:hypothetical protein
MKERHLLVTDVFHMVTHSKGGANRAEQFTSLNDERRPSRLRQDGHFYFFFLRFPFTKVL